MLKDFKNYTNTIKITKEEIIFFLTNWTVKNSNKAVKKMNEIATV